jgi:hypothetical protein
VCCEIQTETRSISRSPLPPPSFALPHVFCLPQAIPFWLPCWATAPTAIFAPIFPQLSFRISCFCIDLRDLFSTSRSCSPFNPFPLPHPTPSPHLRSPNTDASVSPPTIPLRLLNSVLPTQQFISRDLLGYSPPLRCLRRSKTTTKHLRTGRPSNSRP